MIPTDIVAPAGGATHRPPAGLPASGGGEAAVVALLLALLCWRVWGFGPAHTDDAIWALQARQPGADPIGDWATSQGRLWAYPVGTLMLHALFWQGTLYGEALKLGSFVVFFAAFHLLVAAHCGRRLAILSACVFVSLHALRWEGSALTAYPLLTWPSATAFTLAAFAGRHYGRTGSRAALASCGVLLFASLFNNEGVTLLFCGLFPVLVAAEALRAGPPGEAWPRRLSAPRPRRLFIVFGLAVVLYAALALIWARLHPSHYAGHALAPVSPRHIATVLLHLATNGSVLHDIYEPYAVTFSDALTHTGGPIAYRAADALRTLPTAPLAVVAGVLGAVVAFRVLTRHSGDGPGEGPRLILAAVIGGMVAFVPILPVAMTVKYQTLFFDQHVHAYVLTILSHFGTSLILAALAAACLARARGRLRPALGLALGLGLGASASIAFVENDAIASDMRPEAGRWRVLGEAVALAAAAKLDATILWAPRFASGSWFTVLPDGYWSDYARARWGKDLEVLTRSSVTAEAGRPLAILDYRPIDSGWDFVVSLVRRSRAAAGTGLVADRVAVGVTHPTPSRLARYVLEADDPSGFRLQTKLGDLPRAAEVPGWRLAANFAADPDSVHVVADGEPPNLAIVCPATLPVDTRVTIGLRSRGASDQCLGNTYLASHWAAPEKRGAWTLGPDAVLTVPVSSPPGEAVTLLFDVSSYTGFGFVAGDQHVAVEVHGQRLADWDFATAADPPDTRLTVPADLRDPDGSLTIRFTIDPPLSPKRLGVAPDERELGLFLCGLTLGSGEDAFATVAPRNGCLRTD